MMDLLEKCEAHKLWIETMGKKGTQLNLDEADLRNINPGTLMFEQVFFSECNLSGMTFEGTDFYQSEFYSCNFRNAHFTNCNFRKSTLDYSDFSDVTFVGCKFSRADAFKANFSRCTFEDCSFVGFNIMEGSLDGVKCKTTDFDGAYLDKVKLDNFTLDGAKNLDKVNHVSFYLTEDATLVEGDAAAGWLIAHNG